jgi:hypothetical protein
VVAILREVVVLAVAAVLLARVAAVVVAAQVSRVLVRLCVSRAARGPRAQGGQNEEFSKRWSGSGHVITRIRIGTLLY